MIRKLWTLIKTIKYDRKAIGFYYFNPFFFDLLCQTKNPHFNFIKCHVKLKNNKWILNTTIYFNRDSLYHEEIENITHIYMLNKYDRLRYNDIVKNLNIKF